MPLINVADMPDPADPEGRSYRQVNAEKRHDIQLGALVEIEGSGVRLFVVSHGRDCDQTPLYYLCADKDDIIQEDPRFMNRKWIGGYSSSSISVIKEPKAPEGDEPA